MKRLRLGSIIAGLGTGLILGAAGVSDRGAGYSAAPPGASVRDAAANVVEFTRFNNWLNEKHEAVKPERVQGLREHLYSIIDSQVKHLHARTGATYPAEQDLVLSGGFAWAVRMGVPGAHLILARMDPGAARALRLSAHPPDSFRLSLDGERFVLASSPGVWRATFPWYFMIGDLRDFEAANRLRTQVAIISTGFGRHTGGDGYSQATIMPVYSPAGDAADFTPFWLEKHGLTIADKVTDSGRRLPTYGRYDPGTRIHTELVFPAAETGAMAISYMGLDGTYQWNRQHFEDLLAILRVSSKDPPS